MTAAYTNFSACLHGIDAGKVSLYRDEVNSAIFVYLDETVSIRVDLRYPEKHERDIAGLLRLAEVAAQAAADLERHAAPDPEGGGSG